MIDLQVVQDNETELKRLAKLLKCGIFDVAETYEKVINHIKNLEIERDELLRKLKEPENAT